MHRVERGHVARADVGVGAVVIRVNDHVFSSAESQRLACAADDAFDPAQKQQVVATGVGGLGATFQMRRAAVDQGNAVDPGRDGDCGEAVGPASGKAVGNVDLVLGQDVHHKTAGPAVSRETAGVDAQAPDDQWRVERHRVEGVGRHADGSARVVKRGDYRDAGNESTQAASQFAWVDGRRHRGRCVGHMHMPFRPVC